MEYTIAPYVNPASILLQINCSVLFVRPIQYKTHSHTSCFSIETFVLSKQLMRNAQQCYLNYILMIKCN